MKLNLSKRIALIVACLIIAIVAGIGITSIKLSSDTLIQNAKETLLMQAEDGVEILEANIGKDINILMELANRARTQTMEWDVQRESLIDDVARLGYTGIGVVNLDGTVRYVLDNTTANLSQVESATKALQGIPNMSGVMVDKNTNIAAYMIAVPIRVNGNIEGALIGWKDAKTLSDMIDNMGFGENGYAFILNADGTTYAHKNYDFVLQEDNMFADIETDGDRKDLGLAFKTLGMGNKGVIEYDFQASKRYMGVVPIENTGYTLAVGALESDVLLKVKRLRTILFIAAIVFLGIGLLVALLIGSSISKPIVEYSKLTDKLANYDLTFDENSQVVKYLERGDEIGQIGNSLATMQKNFIDLISQVVDISQQVASSSEELTATSQQSSIAADEVARAIEDIAKGASDQAKDTETGAMNIEELGDLIASNKKDIERLTQAAYEINKLKDDGLNIIKDLVEKTESSGIAAKDINEIIITTNQSASKIENASEMIRNISEQTNLLALNAAIEAARAGDAGRGFAVVAQEIRKLAEESNKFTEEIAAIITELAEKTETAVKTMEEVGKIVGSQTESVFLTNERYQGIARSIEDIEDLIRAINESETLMETKKDEVIGIIQNLSAISEENAAGTEEASASVEEQTASIEEIASSSEVLAELADEMQQSIARFRM